MHDADGDARGRLIESARSHAEAQRAEARRLEAELPVLNARLGAARQRQEHMHRPSTLVREKLPQRLTDVGDRLRARWRRR